MRDRLRRIGLRAHRSCRSERPGTELRCLLVAALLCGACAPTPKPAALPPPPSAPQRTPEERADALLAQMTLDEKIGQMMNDAPAIERLGIPAYNWWSEALHGVARAGLATVFPQAIGLAASWDQELLLQVATAISDEARAKHHEAVRLGKHVMYRGLTLWSPNINIVRDPRWGRGQETYGEDPFLSGKLAVQFVHGLQGDDPHYLKTIATLKHFAVHSGPEPLRHEFDARTDARDLYQTYLPQFELGVREGGAQSVMCAYNRYDGEPACANQQLLGHVLREQWGFGGYVVSDCGAIGDFHLHHGVTHSPAESAALAVRRGTDLECGKTYESLRDAVRAGQITEAELDRSVKRLLIARVRLGLLDDQKQVPYAQIPMSVVDSAEHRALAEKSAEESIVLLKNAAQTLPLRRDLRSIAVIGPNADQWLTLLGNYNGLPAQAVTPLEGIRRAVAPSTRVVYAQGSDLAEGVPIFTLVPAGMFTTPEGAPGLSVSYYQNSDLQGEPLFQDVQPSLDANWGDGAPRAGMNDDDFGVRWRGHITPGATGRYQLGVLATCRTQLNLNGAKIAFTNYHYKDEMADPRLRKSEWIELQAGKSYDLEVTASETYGDARVQLVWAVPQPNLKADALKAAASADAVVMVVGLSANLEGEQLPIQIAGFKGGDRTDLALPKPQRELIRDVVALGKPVVLVTLSGSALALNWEQSHVPAILAAWYPGQAAGDALAKVLFGDVNPAGRLPVTFYHSADDLPPFEDYHITTQTYRFFTGEPLYPFGYGLSYSRFHYSELQLPQQLKAGERLSVSARVTNSGGRDGDEVVEVYVAARQPAPHAPLRALAGFQRLHLAAGASTTVQFSLSPESFATIDEQGARHYLSGAYELSVGGGQPLAQRESSSDFVLGEVQLAGE